MKINQRVPQQRQKDKDENEVLIAPNIFRAYDIRGVYPEEINEEITQKLALAFIKFLKPLKIIIGRDCRLSSPSLFRVLSETMIENGVWVIDIGLSSTPLFYWAIQSEKTDGGIMISASHNPPNYNGFKLYRRQAIPISGDTGIGEIKNLLMKGKILVPKKEKGRIIRKNLTKKYLDFIFSKAEIKTIKPLKIVIDAGNGMAGPEVREMFKKIPVKLTELYFEPDGRFPNHQANPLKEETLIDLKKAILKKRADLGIAFDGDADRVIFIDEKANTIRGDLITALMAKELLKENPGRKILYEVRSSQIVKEIIEKNGGKAILGRAGHSLIKEQMRREDIFFAGELSGHYFFKEFGFVECPLFLTLKILEIISRENKKISQILRPFKKYFHSGEINFEVKDKKGKIKEIQEYYQRAPKILKIDGLTVQYNDWWFNLRPSNTEDLLRLNIEAKTKKLLEKNKKELIKIIGGK